MINDFTLIGVVEAHAVSMGEEQGSPHAGETEVANARSSCLHDSRERCGDRDQDNAVHQDETGPARQNPRPDDRKPESQARDHHHRTMEQHPGTKFVLECRPSLALFTSGAAPCR